MGGEKYYEKLEENSSNDDNRSVDAVSYTHLDVYKRQLWGRDFGVHKRTGGRIGGTRIMNRAVSYTHLDVYKRQQLGRLRIHQLWVI